MSQMGSNVPTPQIEIVGSGPVALAAALATHQSGQKTMLRARVWQARTDDALFDARVYALNAASRALLVQLGVWSRLPAERVCAVREMRVWSAPKQSPMTFDAHDAHTDALAWIVEHNELMRALTHAVAESAITQASPEATPLVAPKSGALLLADGIDSALAQRFGLSTTFTEYDHTAMVCTIALAASHPRGQAWQMFSPAAFPHSVLACLPLPQGQACIVWSAANDEHRAQRCRFVQSHQRCIFNRCVVRRDHLCAPTRAAEIAPTRHDYEWSRGAHRRCSPRDTPDGGAGAQFRIGRCRDVDGRLARRLRCRTSAEIGGVRAGATNVHARSPSLDRRAFAQLLRCVADGERAAAWRVCRRASVFAAESDIAAASIWCSCDQSAVNSNSHFKQDF
jgi:2-polyprenyl-6-methoxyphenol hydroxylase-like FAD-dependent oxidoreductase